MDEIVVGDIFIKKSCCDIRRTVLEIDNQNVLLQNTIGDRQSMLLCQLAENFEKVDHVNITASIANKFYAEHLASKAKRKIAELSILQKEADRLTKRYENACKRQSHFSHECTRCLTEALCSPDCKSCATYKEYLAGSKND